MAALEPRSCRRTSAAVVVPLGAAVVPLVAIPGHCLGLKAIPAVALAWLARALLRLCSHPERKAPVQSIGREEAVKGPTFPSAPLLPSSSQWGRKDGWWVDGDGRKVIARGFNFSGNSKLPFLPECCRGTHLADNKDEIYKHHRDVSFVGRPCPLEELDEHLQRMRACGFNVLRLLVTWESLEHAGPMQYDEDHVAYIQTVCKKADEHGLKVWIDPHQDVWSRFTGGDGAPGWTLELCNLQVSPKLRECGAADLHWEYDDPTEMRHLSWPEGYRRLAVSTMFTLFYGGDHYCPGAAPNWEAALGSSGSSWLGSATPPAPLQGLSIQQVLQECYIRCYELLATRLSDLPNVLGFETMNEPHLGYIGHRDLAKAATFPKNIPESPFMQMVKADQVIWSDQCGGCLWRNAGVWDFGADGAPELLKPHYFTTSHGLSDHLLPFIKKYGERIRGASPSAQIFVGTPAFGEESEEPWPAKQLGPLKEHGVLAMHHYDGLLLDQKHFFKHLNIDVGDVFSASSRSCWQNLRSPPILPVCGADNIFQTQHEMMYRKRRLADRAFTRPSPSEQIETLPQDSIRDETHMASSSSSVPCIVGEIGIPFDIRAGFFGKLFDPQAHIEAMDNSMKALDRGFWSFTLWNYSLDNTDAWGDGWNRENLSVYSSGSSSGVDWSKRPWIDQPEVTFRNLRALPSLVRPHVVLLAGEPVYQHFHVRKRRYALVWQAASLDVCVATEIFVPLLHFGGGFEVLASEGIQQKHWEPNKQTLSIEATRPGYHRLVLVARV